MRQLRFCRLFIPDIDKILFWWQNKSKACQLQGQLPGILGWENKRSGRLGSLTVGNSWTEVWGSLQWGDGDATVTNIIAIIIIITIIIITNIITMGTPSPSSSPSSSSSFINCSNCLKKSPVMFNLSGCGVVCVKLEQYHLSFGLWKIFEKYLKNIPILDKWVRLEFSNGRCSPILFFHHLLLFWTPTSFGGSQWFWHLVSQMWGQVGLIRVWVHPS